MNTNVNKRKKGITRCVSIQPELELYERIKAEAEKDRHSMGAWVLVQCEKALQEREIYHNE